MKTTFRNSLELSILAGVLLATPAIAAVNIGPLAWVGNGGNSDDPLTGYGAVADAYQIMKYEVTNSQYVEFLNSVAKTDTYALYNPAMASDVRGGITRSGSSGAYSYAVRSNMGDKPVN